LCCFKTFFYFLPKKRWLRKIVEKAKEVKARQLMLDRG